MGVRSQVSGHGGQPRLQAFPAHTFSSCLPPACPHLLQLPVLQVGAFRLAGQRLSTVSTRACVLPAPSLRGGLGAVIAVSETSPHFSTASSSFCCPPSSWRLTPQVLLSELACLVKASHRLTSHSHLTPSFGSSPSDIFPKAPHPCPGRQDIPPAPEASSAGHHLELHPFPVYSHFLVAGTPAATARSLLWRRCSLSFSILPEEHTALGPRPKWPARFGVKHPAQQSLCSEA